MLGAVLGGGGTATESLAPDQLRGIVPERLGGLARSEISVERNAALGIQISQAEATYSDGAGKQIDLEITDLGGTMGLMALAAWANIEQDRQTSTGYETNLPRQQPRPARGLGPAAACTASSASSPPTGSWSRSRATLPTWMR